MENETRIAAPPKSGGAPLQASIVIVNYNGGEHLAACVAALREQTLTEFEAVVVDNASNDGSLHPPKFPGSLTLLVTSGQIFCHGPLVNKYAFSYCFRIFP